VRIRITGIWLKPLIVILKEKKLKASNARFYINSGAGISIIKKHKLHFSITINREKITDDSRNIYYATSLQVKQICSS
jgi:hypothetical protein